jgi:hypothetical protein
VTLINCYIYSFILAIVRSNSTMQKNLLPFYSILFFLFSHTPVQAQPDTSFVRLAVEETMQSYRSAVGLQAHLYNGAEYFVPVKHYVEGHQFFKDKAFQKGRVLYDGSMFVDVPMLYDIMNDELVTVHTGSGLTQKLVKQKVASFSLHNHNFIYIEVDSMTSLSMASGFYDLLYEGEIRALVRREKTLQEKATIGGMEGNFTAIDKYFIWKDGIYHPVRSKGSVLRVLKDQRKQLNRFTNANKLRFGKGREDAILKLVQHYDTLQNDTTN